MVIFFDGSSNRGNEVWSSDSFFQIEMAHVSNGFANLKFFDDDLNHHFLQGMTAIGSTKCFFDFLIVFAGAGRIVSKLSMLEGRNRLAPYDPAGWLSSDS